MKNRRNLLLRITSLATLGGLATVSRAAASYMAAASNISFLQSGRGAVTRSVQRKLAEIVSLADFGAVGDGVANDTAAINAALSSGAARVAGVPGATYLVNYTGTTTLDTVVTNYCLKLPSNVEFDLNGSTLYLANGANSSVIVLCRGDKSTTNKATLRNGTINGNNANQTYSPPVENPCIFFGNGANIVVDNITVINATDVAGYFIACKNSTFTNLTCLGSLGAGWQFGSADKNQAVYGSFIDNLYAERCTGSRNAFVPGNPTIFVVTDCTVGNCVGRNCGGGHKVQNTSLNSTFAQFVFDGSPVSTETNCGTTNSGTKIQGTPSPLLIPQNIQVTSVVSRNCYGSGLYIEIANDCAVGEYHGYNNETGATGYGDVWLGGNRNHIGLVHSVGCAGPNNAIYINDTAVDCSIGKVNVMNCTGIALNNQSPNDFTCGDVTAVDTAGKMSLAMNYSSPTTRGQTGLIKTTPPTVSQPARLSGQPGAVGFRFGPMIMSERDPLYGTITLTQNSTTTSVSNGNTHKIYQGVDYLQPIILFTPMNSAAIAVGLVSPEFPDAGFGTGFTLHHANPGTTTAIFHYNIIGWANLPAVYGV